MWLGREMDGLHKLYKNFIFAKNASFDVKEDLARFSHNVLYVWSDFRKRLRRVLP